MNRHILRTYRSTGLRVAIPMFLAFGFMDYLYKPELFTEWVSLRVLFAASLASGYYIMGKYWFRKAYLQHFIVFQTGLACAIINYMIYTSGGFYSHYLIGLVLTSLISINIFKTSPKFTIASLALSYIPTFGIIVASAPGWELSLLYVFYFLSITLLSYIFSVNSYKALIRGALKETSLKDQVKKFERSELLKRQFPKYLREILESGNNIPERKFIANAVVGFADISNSTSLANRIGLNLDWQLKEAFLANATKIATQHDFVVLTQMGDGFLFLANYEENNNWHFNIIGFFETLGQRFDQIKNEMLPPGTHDDVGIKCGAAMGPTLVGFLGEEQAYFTAMGPEVNLASRLCDKATPGEVVLSSKIWYILKSIGMPWTTDSTVFKDLKGFDDDIGAVILKPENRESGVTHCEECGEQLSLIKTPEGFMDLVCPNDHESESLKKAS